MSERRVIAVPQEPQDNPEQMALVARLEIEAYRVQMELLVQSVLQAVRAFVDLLASPGRRVPPALPDPRVRMALLALRDRPAHLALPGRLALLEQRATRVT